MGRHRARPSTAFELNTAWSVGARNIFLQGRCVYVWRWPFDACVHPRASCQSIRLADTSGIHRRFGFRPTYARPYPDACCIYWIQARRFCRSRGRGICNLSTVVLDDTFHSAIAQQNERSAMAQGLHAGCWTGRDRRACSVAGAVGPHAAPDPFTWLVLALTVLLL